MNHTSLIEAIYIVKRSLNIGIPHLKNPIQQAAFKEVMRYAKEQNVNLNLFGPA